MPGNLSLAGMMKMRALHAEGEFDGNHSNEMKCCVAAICRSVPWPIYSGNDWPRVKGPKKHRWWCPKGFPSHLPGTRQGNFICVAHFLHQAVQYALQRKKNSIIYSEEIHANNIMKVLQLNYTCTIKIKGEKDLQ